MKQEVTVTGMTCQGCANAVKTKFEKIKDVNSVEVDLDNDRATLTTETEIPKDSLKTALEDTNYEVV